MKRQFILPNQETVTVELATSEPLIHFLKSEPCPKPLQSILALKVNGKPYDLRLPLPEQDPIEVVTPETAEGLEILRHSTSHLLAQAVTELFPKTLVTIGPATGTGFYYDFAFSEPITEADLAKIEARMQAIIDRDQPFERMEMKKEEAVAFFHKLGERYKVEILESIPEATVSLYQQGEFVDLCRGPHLPSAKSIKAFKLLSLAGAYWRGDEKREQLTRIYGTTFATEAELQQYLHRLEEAVKRDHRKLGKALDLFSLHEEFGPGLIYWHPKGGRIRHIIESFWREEHYKVGYELVYTPHVAKLELWKISGHTEFYQENMFPQMELDEQRYQLKPMNCPFHIQIYKTHLRSYRELPLRWAELGTVYRYERSGVMHGLMRVRGFTQDDAHLFCRPDQLAEEIGKILQFTRFVLSTFGFSNYEVYLSTRPEKFVGSVEHWEQATQALQKALEQEKFPYEVDPGEGVFYGPKIDIKIKDVLDRAWQCATIQVDFNLPERFDLTFRAADGKDHRPIMIHRALLGSLERFFGILLEHYGGAFPLWLAPIQVAVLSIADRHIPYAESVKQALTQAGLRVDLFTGREKMGHKIREAQLQKIPYMVILGDQEVEANQLSIRSREKGDEGKWELAAFQTRLTDEVRARQPGPSLEIPQEHKV